MPRMTGKHAVMQMLRAEGVQYIFGNPGTTETPLMDALEDYPDIKYMLTVQEGVAMGMADAYSRALGQPSFVNLHIETGLANGISLLQNAYDGGSPIVLTACNKDIRELAHGRTDLREMARQFTKWSVEVSHPEAIPVAMRKAFYEAKTPPTGPTFISFTANSLDDEADVEIVPSSRSFNSARPDSTAVELAVDTLSSASNPIILVGDSVGESGALEEVIELSEKLGCKVYSTMFSGVNFPTSHPHYMGPIRLGYRGTRDALETADVIVMAGRIASNYYMFSDPPLRYFSGKTKLIHIHWDSSNVGQTEPTDVGIVADPKTAINEIVQGLGINMHKDAITASKARSRLTRSEKESAYSKDAERTKLLWENAPMSPERMMAELSKSLPENVIIANDAVTSGGALHHSVQFDNAGSLYGGRGGALGWGMGGTLGIKLANPDRPVVGVIGDGSAMMTIQALWTAAAENIPVVYVICNNGVYRVLKVNMNMYKELVLKGESPPSKYIGMDFSLPFDMAGIAKSMGVYSRRIEDPNQIAPAVEEALNLGAPALLDVIIDPSL
ncbi:MAG: thiamine pyrophosphate-binding protein [Chloroflexota bacterium]|nr:thiamine pyrophosphate-binding protein [Chloroflexota bacterium]